MNEASSSVRQDADPAANVREAVRAIMADTGLRPAPKLYLSEYQVRRAFRHLPLHVWKQLGGPLSVEDWCRKNTLGCEVVLTRPIRLEDLE